MELAYYRLTQRSQSAANIMPPSPRRRAKSALTQFSATEKELFKAHFPRLPDNDDSLLESLRSRLQKTVAFMGFSQMDIAKLALRKATLEGMMEREKERLQEFSQKSSAFARNLDACFTTCDNNLLEVY